MIILGIETSCDETALALIETRGDNETFECRVIQSLVHSQAELHSAYGGVFPTLAKREHGKNLAPLLEKTLKDMPTGKTLTDEEFRAALEPFKAELERTNPDLWESISHADFLKEVPSIDRIAVTEGPGLEPALWVGINCARVLGALWNIPTVPINHMEGHIVGSLLESDAPAGAWQKLKTLPFPAIALLISGGHTELVSIESVTKQALSSSVLRNSLRSIPLKQSSDASKESLFRYDIIGQTKDDAVGEAFDKAARLLGLPYPGGPHIAKLAHEAYEAKTPSPLSLPRPMIKSGDLDFSFSGLKTAVLYAVRDETKKRGEILSDDFKKGLAYEFEQAVADVLDAKLRAALEKTGAQSVIVGGGVAANHVLQKRFEKVAADYSIPILLPSRHISGDNALMIALAATLDANEKPPITGELRADGTKRLS